MQNANIDKDDRLTTVVLEMTIMFFKHFHRFIWTKPSEATSARHEQPEENRQSQAGPGLYPGWR